MLQRFPMLALQQVTVAVLQSIIIAAYTFIMAYYNSYLCLYYNTLQWTSTCAFTLVLHFAKINAYAYTIACYNRHL